ARGSESWRERRSLDPVSLGTRTGTGCEMTAPAFVADLILDGACAHTMDGADRPAEATASARFRPESSRTSSCSRKTSSTCPATASSTEVLATLVGGRPVHDRGLFAHRA